ncbi:uncharacterized protein CTRU02_203044 [Colletotrichum truncatum]|uniref:Uncharacterized protein n=1 Tax=Colletotrichum truncatum TaxID=5467 RepID=A0ACC3Z8C1_COLTU|nr:uncharacterized protein CTRU02_13135 [Colletotrichum truncatum]KAF6783627.1 hypothetical protein CTRU02_13135 [Colletotrichum truncatum]
MVSFHSFIVTLIALGVSAAPAPQASGNPETPTEPRCDGVQCPANSVCKVFDFNLEKPVGCFSEGPVPPETETCGSVICPIGTSCCNPTCGVCAKPDESCLQWVCDSPVLH